MISERKNANVLILGGGKKVADLLNILRDIRGVDVVGAYDASTGLDKFLSKKTVDIIINTSGSKEFQQMLDKINPGEINILGPKATQLLLNLADKNERVKSELIATASHELRTPLAAIKESVMLVLDGTTGKVPSRQEHFLNIAKRNIDRLTARINNLLDLSKIETGKMELKMAPCDIPSLVRKALGSAEVMAKEKKLDIRSDFGESLPRILCDPGKIAKVLGSLIENAIKFTPPGGKISVHCTVNNEKEKDFIRISVKDAGIGIDKKDIPRLFTRFGQLDSSLTRCPGGMGVSLVICKEFVEMHGGRIHADSEPGKGSTFSFTLPVKKQLRRV